MATETDLLRLAVEDNIGWCGAVCAANGSQDLLTAGIWVNLKPSPPFYPNVITRRPGAQAEVICAIERIRSLYPSCRPAIKDSFADLMLKDHGFERVLQGDWYGHTCEPQGVKIGGPWARVSSGNELRQWEAAWGEGSGKAIFSDALLSNKRITFWHQKNAEGIISGFISFRSASSVGLSNWFSTQSTPALPAGALETARSNLANLPIVLWSADDLTRDCDGIRKLGPMQIWVTPAPTQ